MPELPEVEAFRQLLLPLVVADREDNNNERPSSSSSPSSPRPLLQIEARGEPNVNRLKLTQAEREEISARYACTDVLRKGKQLCLVLSARSRDAADKGEGTTANSTKYLFLHMGMTGRIRVAGKEENWGGKKLNGEEPASVKVASGRASHTTAEDGETFPPKYTLLIFSNPTNGHTAYFCDPRKFGSCHLADDLSALDELAPDALNGGDPAIVQDRILPALSHQSRGIKTTLLDQKKAVSGVGNWVADEVLYQSGIHPDQSYLTRDEAANLLATLQSVVQTAVACLVEHDTHYPEDWLFAYRWTKKQASKDARGRTISFLQSGGRTSAIVASIQKLYKGRKPNKKEGKAPGGKAAAKSKDNMEPPLVTPRSTASAGKRKTIKDLQEFRHIEASAASSSSAAASVRKNRKTSNGSKLSSDVQVTRRRSPRHTVTPP